MKKSCFLLAIHAVISSVLLFCLGLSEEALLLVMMLAAMAIELFQVESSMKKLEKSLLSANVMNIQQVAVTAGVQEPVAEEGRQKGEMEEDIISRKYADAFKSHYHALCLAEIERYVRHVLSPYMEDAELSRLIGNIRSESFSPCRTDGRLNTTDLKHLSWNIGQRLGWSGERRARFAKNSFPVEMDDCSINSIIRTLRHDGACFIQLDVPSHLGFGFHDIVLPSGKDKA